MSEQEKRPSGVDPTLVEWMLSLTPAERLALLQRYADEIKVLSNARKLPQNSADFGKP